MSRHEIKESLLNDIMGDDIADTYISTGLAAKLSNIPNDHKRKRTLTKKTVSVNGEQLKIKYFVTRKSSKSVAGIWGVTLENDKDKTTITMDEFLSYEVCQESLHYWRMVSLLDGATSDNTVESQFAPHISGSFEKRAIETLCKAVESGSYDNEQIRIIDPNNTLKYVNTN